MTYGFRIYENETDLKTLSMRDDLTFVQKGQIRTHLRNVSYLQYEGEIATVPNNILDFLYKNNLNFTILGTTSSEYCKCVIAYSELNKSIKDKKKPLQFPYMLLSNIVDYNQYLSRISYEEKVIARFYIMLV